MRQLSAREAVLDDSQASQLITTLASHLGHIEGVAPLSDITESAIEAFKSGGALSHYALDLLPIALTAIDSVDSEGGHAAGYCRDILDRVASHAWPPSHIAAILGSLRGFSMPIEALAEAVHRGAAMARFANHQDLPAIVHQLLVLAGSPCRDLALTVTQLPPSYYYACWIPCCSFNRVSFFI